MEHSSLDDRGIMLATDKCSLNHDYLRHYEQAFSRFRDQDINIVEIGIFGGASLTLWENFFSKAKIVGIDINPECSKYQTERSTIEIGSQADTKFLSRIVDRFPPTIIIDDGSHRADHIQITFEYLFPRLLPGGVYVVEDMHLHFGAGAGRNRGDATITPQEYFGMLSNVLSGEPPDERLNGTQADFFNSIDEITFFRRGAFIWKKRDGGPLSRLDHLRSVIEQSGKQVNWRRLADMIVSSGGDLDQAESAVRQGITISPKSWRLHKTLAKILQRKGDRDGAQAVLRDARHLAPEKDQALIDRREARLQKRGTLEKSADALRKRDKELVTAEGEQSEAERRQARRDKRAARKPTDDDFDFDDDE